MLVAVLLVGASALCAALALQYARVFYGAVRTRHPARFADISLFGRADTILALNDADVYASWRLARVNVAIATLCVAAAAISATFRS